MTDLYAALDIPRTADRAEIRRAYRARAKSAHPDAGGSRARFDLVKLAHDTLTDDERRARYDQTGEVEDKRVDNRSAQLLEMLASGLDAAMAKLNSRAQQPAKSDMVRLVKVELRELRHKWNAERTEFQAGTDRWRDLLNRWDGELMKTILTHRVKACEAHVSVLADRIGIADRALDALDSETFRFDPEPENEYPPPGTMQYVGIMDILRATR